MKRTAVAAPAPRPSDEEMLEAIARLTLRDLTRVRDGLRRLVDRVRTYSVRTAEGEATIVRTQLGADVLWSIRAPWQGR